VSQMPPLVQDRPRYLAAGLASALAASDQLSLVYQPRINLRSRACSSAEALLRWTHPKLGPVPPAEFIPIAERSGMMGSVTAWVIDRALGDLRRWTELGFRTGVSINVSALNLSEQDFVDRLWETIGRRGVDPDRVELEFTEGASLRDAPRLRETMTELVGIGVRVSIDDFGAGYSNLSYLRDLPASTLKIDRSFVRSLAANPRDQIIVRSVIALAHALDYRVVGEGIEDAEALALLAAWACDEGQGYHISRPLPLDALLSWLGGRSNARGEG
jgi:EAL domain-containing protein (putative c-di-GMP-specific phosphodiesterase class I)